MARPDRQGASAGAHKNNGTSIDCQVKVISVVDRPHILGLQFDNHSASKPEVKSWLDKDEEWLASLQDMAIDRQKILTAADHHSMEIRCEFEMFFANFVRLIDSICFKLS